MCDEMFTIESLIAAEALLACAMTALRTAYRNQEALWSAPNSTVGLDYWRLAGEARVDVETCRQAVALASRIRNTIAEALPSHVVGALGLKK